MPETQRLLRPTLLCALSLLTACDDTAVPAVDAGAGSVESCYATVSEGDRPAGWTTESHCSGVAGNYEKLFDDTVVHRIDIAVSADDYAATMADLADKLSGGGGPGGPGGPPGGSLDDGEDPIWVPVTVAYDGLTWTRVGMRYKGNSSLRSAWQSGVRKLSFRLNFDKFEDTYPEIANQRFWGFKKLTFSNGFKDRSLLRDKVAADIFREGGVPAARGAFVRVFVDFGEGPVYFGLYTMIEDPSNRMLDTQFTDDGGNLYKPEGAAASWQFFDETHFEKKTNEEGADWSDVIAAIDALHADRSDPAAWRAGLEAVFDVDAFLRCLAINQAMVNWDSYGFMTHNYYVYADPSRGGRLVWFPWDLNEAMLARGIGGADPTSVMLDEIGSDWPLIRYLLDDPVYRARYEAELRTALEGPFAVDAVEARMQRYHALIAPYVVGADGEVAPYTFLASGSEFETALTSGDDALEPHVEARHVAVRQALGE